MMNTTFADSLLADILLIFHALFIAFVVFGFGLIVVGIVVRWRWVKNFWFRFLHLIVIGIVVAETWFGAICPLTTWENDLREAIGGVTYSETFIQYWLQRLIFYEFPQWVFNLVYTLFGMLVLLTWIIAPPKFPWLKRDVRNKPGV
jgi:hypothetical protein